MNDTARINKASLWLMELADEVESICTCSIGAKYQIMLFMTYIDIFSKIWNIHNEKVCKNQKDIFVAWVDKFMFSDSNKHYTNEIGNISSELFYQIRNSLIHFSSLPNITNVGIFITSDSKSEFCNRYPNETKNKEVIVLAPKVLALCLVTAVICTMEEIETQGPRYKSTMLQIANKLGKESCVKR